MEEKTFLRDNFGRIWRARVSGLRTVPHFIMKLVLTLSGWLIRVEGAGRLESLPYPVIFASNHNTYIETLFLPCLLMYLTGRKVSFLVHWMWKDFPVIGWLMRFIDPVWVWTKRVRFSFGRREKPNRDNAAVPAAVRRFRSGACLGIFPEGRRNHDPRFLLKGRRGLGEIALRCGAPVVPLGIDFPARLKWGRIPALGKMILRIGPPLDQSAERASWEENEARFGSDRARQRRLAGELVRRVNDKAMAAIARLCGKELPP